MVNKELIKKLIVECALAAKTLVNILTQLHKELDKDDKAK